jgi:RNA polymerase sigma-70 factor (ECF subfamily)
LDLQGLIYRIQFNNDESAFNALYKQQIVKLYRFAYSFIADKEASEEIVNDIFLKVWLSRHSLDTIRNIQVYLYVAVKNACLNHVRSNVSKQKWQLNLSESFYFHLSVDPSQLLINKELQKKIVKAIDDLPPRCRLIFKMVKEDNLTSKEVAEILNLSNKTVFAQLSIALKKLECIIE